MMVLVERFMTVLVSWCRPALTPGTPEGKNRTAGRHRQDMTLHAPRHTGCGSGPPTDTRAWRRCRLVEAGMPDELAAEVATDPRFDLHALLQLLDRGCPPDLAVRITAPLRGDAGQ